MGTSGVVREGRCIEDEDEGGREAKAPLAREAGPAKRERDRGRRKQSEKRQASHDYTTLKLVVGAGVDVWSQEKMMMIEDAIREWRRLSRSSVKK